MNAALVRKELNQIKRMIKTEFPDAIFRVSAGAEPSPRSLWLEVFTDSENRWDIQDLINKPRTDLLVRKKFVITLLPQPLAYLPARLRDGQNRRATRYAKPPTATRTLRERKRQYRAKASAK
jgi:hypothetical protein